MVMRDLRLRPGIEPRMPIWFGWSGVSHTFTVAHGPVAWRAWACRGAAASERGEEDDKDGASHLPCQNSVRRPKSSCDGFLTRA